MRCQYLGPIPILLMQAGRVYEVAPGAITDMFTELPTSPAGQWKRLKDPDPAKATPRRQEV